MKDNEVFAWEKKGWNEGSLDAIDEGDPEKWYNRVGLEVAHRTSNWGVLVLRVLELGELVVGGVERFSETNSMHKDVIAIGFSSL
jgi:hypothetical protein